MRPQVKNYIREKLKSNSECFTGEGGFPGVCWVCELVFTIEKGFLKSAFK